MDKNEKNKSNSIATGIVIASSGDAKTEKTISDIPLDVKRVIVLEQKTKDLEDKAKEIEKSLIKSERNQDKALNFMMGIAGVIVVAFFLALIPLLFDYYKDNAERYENYTKRIDRLDIRMDILENKKGNKCYAK
ncbi:MAG: hypothetical protein WC678_04585 [Parcubacteria group bacterium]|jgi:hypothetical protein